MHSFYHPDVEKRVSTRSDIQGNPATIDDNGLKALKASPEEVKTKNNFGQ